MKVSKKLCASLSTHDICRGVSDFTVRWPLIFWNHLQGGGAAGWRWYWFWLGKLAILSPIGWWWCKRRGAGLRDVDVAVFDVKLWRRRVVGHRCVAAYSADWSSCGMQAVLNDRCSVLGASCFLLHLLLHLTAAEINKQLQLLFAKTLPLKLRHSDVIVMSSWYYFLLK